MQFGLLTGLSLYHPNMGTSVASNEFRTFPRMSPGGRVLLTHDQEVEYGRAWRDGKDREAREKLIAFNRGLVVALARRFAGRGVPLEELVAEGQVGLITAVDRFNPDCGCRFSTYATYWIRQSISEAFAKSLSTRGRLNRSDRAALKLLARAEASFVASTGCAPSYEELGKLLGWRIDRVQAIGSCRSACERRGTLEGDLGAAAFVRVASEVGIDDEGSPRERFRRSIVEMLASLSEAERTAVELRFGFEGGTSRSLEAVAAAMGLRQTIVRNLLAGAVKKLSRLAKASAPAVSELARSA